MSPKRRRALDKVLAEIDQCPDIRASKSSRRVSAGGKLHEIFLSWDDDEPCPAAVLVTRENPTGGRELLRPCMGAPDDWHKTWARYLVAVFREAGRDTTAPHYLNVLS